MGEAWARDLLSIDCNRTAVVTRGRLEGCGGWTTGYGVDGKKGRGEEGKAAGVETFK